VLRLKKKIKKKIDHLMALTWPQGIKRIPINLGGQFATFGANVVTIKYCCFETIHSVGSNKILNQTLYFSILSSFHLSSFFSPPVELLCLFVIPFILLSLDACL
jgi:hypothetical protein